MENSETNQTERSENKWTERETELAEKYGVEPKTVRLLTRIIEERLTDLNDALTKEFIGEPSEKTEEPEAAEKTTGIPGLDRMIVKAPFGTATAVYAGIELGRSNPELGARIQDFVRGTLPEFFEQLNPERSKDGELWDTECDVMPAVQWLRFLDGFKAAMPSETNCDEKGKRAESNIAETGQENVGDPNLRTIKRWLNKATYSQKLVAVLLWQLTSKESEFEKPDDRIGNVYFRQWEEEVIDASGNQEYLKRADHDEAAVTAATAMMIPWRV